MIEALFPKIRRDILALLFGRPEEACYLREIVRVTGGGRGAVARELRALVTAGIILRENQGNLAYYRANQDCPIYPELHSLMLKTAGLADILRETLAKVKDTRLAFVFGSMAKGEGDGASDVDVLVVSGASFDAISAALLKAQKRLGREVASTVYTPKEFREKLQAKQHFLMRVLKEPKILLIGEPDEFV